MNDRIPRTDPVPPVPGLVRRDRVGVALGRIRHGCYIAVPRRVERVELHDGRIGGTIYMPNREFGT